MRKHFIMSVSLVCTLVLPAAGLTQDGMHALLDANAQNVEVRASPRAAPSGNALGLFKPDSPLYSFQRLGEWLKLLLTQHPLEKAKYELTLLERRVEELRDLAERGRLTVERAENLQRKTQQLIETIQRRTEAARGRGLDVEALTQRMQIVLDRQQLILQGILERVPDEARTTIQRAIELTRTGKERLLELLERVPLPTPNKPVITPVAPTGLPKIVPPVTLRPMPSGTIERRMIREPTTKENIVSFLSTVPAHAQINKPINKDTTETTILYDRNLP